MADYRLFFLDASDVILARDEFCADSDQAALFIATRLFDACSEAYSAYELWSGIRRIAWPEGGQAPEAYALVGCADIRAAEMIVADRERILLDSHWIVARSRRLLDETNRLRSALDGSGVKHGC
jgi:hypothetical protein